MMLIQIYDGKNSYIPWQDNGVRFLLDQHA
jgi:hypothetical protein